MIFKRPEGPLAGLEAEAAKRRRRWWILAIVFLLGFGGIVGGRQLYRWIRLNRAAQYAAQADQLVAAGKIEEAIKRYRVALNLAPMGYPGMRGAARLASRLNHAEAPDLWGQVLRLSQATTADRQEYVKALLATGRVREATAVLKGLLQNDPDTTTLVLGARYANATGDLPNAIEFARRAVKQAPAEASAQFLLAEVLAISGDETAHAEARQILWDLTKTEGPFKIKALESLATAADLPKADRDRVMQMLEPAGADSILDALLVADLRLQAQPENSAKIFDQVVARWSQGEDANLKSLVRWLNLHGQYERVLSLLTIDSVAGDQGLLLSRLDALAGLQRWDEIEALLMEPNLRFDPCVVESFRARTAQEKNQTLDAEVHWNHAISLAANNPAKLRFVAGFAEQSHAGTVALRVYEQLSKIPQQAVGAYLATQWFGARNAETTVQRDAAEKVAKLSPNDANAADQLAYLNLLLNREVASNFERAKTLAAQNPTRLAYRVTAALGYLRKQDPASAFAQFQPGAGAPAIEWENTPANWRAVYAATLLANGKTPEADEILKNIPRDKLAPEEKALIKTKP